MASASNNPDQSATRNKRQNGGSCARGTSELDSLNETEYENYLKSNSVGHIVAEELVQAELRVKLRIGKLHANGELSTAALQNELTRVQEKLASIGEERNQLQERCNESEIMSS